MYCSSSATGSAYTSTTRLCFQLYLDGSAQLIYAWCDYSNTTKGNITTKRFCNKFSSSAITQIDIEPIIESTYGVSLSWYCITLTNVNVDHKT